ncbi:hypothetical protein FB451DRAFT_588573 [Mycena latifolia]|nr:hypothetical protein FB451DRAFT_588573 [Mycena latifolia]
MRRPSPFRLPRQVDLLTSIVRPVFLSFALIMMGSPRRAPVRRDSEQALRSSPVRAASCTHSTPRSTARRSHHCQCRAVRPPCTTTSPRAALLHHLEAAEGKEHRETKVCVTTSTRSPYKSCITLILNVCLLPFSFSTCLQFADPFVYPPRQSLLTG